MLQYGPGAELGLSPPLPGQAGTTLAKEEKCRSLTKAEDGRGGKRPLF